MDTSKSERPAAGADVPTRTSWPYWVHWGYCYESGLPFADFWEALECYRKHREDREGAAILIGESYEPADENGDGACTGLTGEEQDAIDACQD